MMMPMEDIPSPRTAGEFNQFGFLQEILIFKDFVTLLALTQQTWLGTLCNEISYCNLPSIQSRILTPNLLSTVI